MNAGEDDDGQPYSVRDEPVAPPKEIQPEPPKPPLAKSWDNIWPLAIRVKIFGVMLVLNVIALPASLLIFQSVPSIVSTLLVSSILQAFLIGTFDRIDLTRSAKGKVALSRTWRVAFYPLKPTPVRWREFESLASGKSYEPRFEDWFIALLLLFYALLPGVLWYWFVIRLERVYVALCKDHGFPDTILYRGIDEARAQEVARTIADATGLPYK